jgi:hypothetical protein
VGLSGVAFAEPVDDAQIKELQAEVQSLRAEVAEFRAKSGEDWLTTQRAAQIRQIVQDVLTDAKYRQQAEDGPSMGYKDGFFIQTADRNFKLVIGGFIQYRYTFADTHVVNPAAYGATPPKSGDINGFGFRYARLTFAGNAFSPNLTYLVTGDFAGDASNVGDFQIVDAYVAYRFTDLLNIRAGSFIVPYARPIYVGAGQQLVDAPLEYVPFSPDRALGVSLFGDVIKDKLQYEVNINNGEKSNKLGRASEVGGSNDNRLGFASRVQYFGGTGKPADFVDESDLRQNNTTLAWWLAGAMGYESANSTTTSFPGKQGSATVLGVSSNDHPGFLSSYPLNGDLYRAAIEGSAKYYGFSFTSACFYQQINENGGAGLTLPAGYSLTSKPSFFQLGYYGQAGYMLNKNWEIVGRVGQLRTEGAPNTMEEYALGLNYYLFGKNFKIQSDVTFIPNEAAYSSSSPGTVLNTQETLFRLQLQLKF